MSRPPEPQPPKTEEKPAATDAPKKNRSMTRKDFGELLKRVISKPDPKQS